jgi:hypothetical protein
MRRVHGVVGVVRTERRISLSEVDALSHSNALSRSRLLAEDLIDIIASRIEYFATTTI